MHKSKPPTIVHNGQPNIVNASQNIYYENVHSAFDIHLTLNNTMGHAGLKWGYVQLATRAQACLVAPAGDLTATPGAFALHHWHNGAAPAGDLTVKSPGQI